MSKYRRHSENLKPCLFPTHFGRNFPAHISNKDHSPYSSQVSAPDGKVGMLLPFLGNSQTIIPPPLLSKSSRLVQATDLFRDHIHEVITLGVLGFKGAILN